MKTAGNKYISPTALTWITSLLLTYFGARLLFLALSVSTFVPPDEVTHAGISKIYSTVQLFPVNSPETWGFGLVTNIPWLYYSVMGKLLHLNLFGIPDLLFLRMLNIPLAFGTVWYAVRLLRLLTYDRSTELLLVTVMTNIPMFSLLSASVSYDNLANLLAAMSIYYLCAFFRERSARLLVTSLLCQMAGNLTKVTFLPLTAVLSILLLCHEVKRIKDLPRFLLQRVSKPEFRHGFTLLLLLTALGANIHLYGGNYLRYGVMNPSLETVVSPDAAMEHRLDARGKIFTLYHDSKISYMDALILAGEIKHAGDKADLFYLLMNYEKLKQNPDLWLGPFGYVKSWAWFMLATIVGIKAHLQMYKGMFWMVPVYLLLSLSAVGFLARWRPLRGGWLPAALAATSLLYAGFIFFEFNYPSYQLYGEPSLTVYGRYLFPVLAPCSVLFCRYLLQLFSSATLRTAVAITTALLFMSYDFPWFLLHATSEWYL